jgi:hypothetical protein
MARDACYQPCGFPIFMANISLSSNDLVRCQNIESRRDTASDLHMLLIGWFQDLP